jgi:hypothetical protein
MDDERRVLIVLLVVMALVWLFAVTAGTCVPHPGALIRPS